MKNKDKGSFYSGLFENNNNQNAEMGEFLNKLYVQNITSDNEKIIKMVLFGNNIPECPNKTGEYFYFFVKIGTYANQQFVLNRTHLSQVYSFELVLCKDGSNAPFAVAIKKLETTENNSLPITKAIVEMEKLKNKSINEHLHILAEKNSGYDDGLSASDVTIFSSIVSVLFNGLVGSVMHFLPQNKTTVATKAGVWGASSWFFTRTWPFAHKKQNLTQKMCVGIAGAAGLYAGTKIMSRFCRYFK